MGFYVLSTEEAGLRTKLGRLEFHLIEENKREWLKRAENKRIGGAYNHTNWYLDFIM